MIYYNNAHKIYIDEKNKKKHYYFKPVIKLMVDKQFKKIEEDKYLSSNLFCYILMLRIN